MTRTKTAATEEAQTTDHYQGGPSKTNKTLSQENQDKMDDSVWYTLPFMTTNHAPVLFLEVQSPHMVLTLQRLIFKGYKYNCQLNPFGASTLSVG